MRNRRTPVGLALSLCLLLLVAPSHALRASNTQTPAPQPSTQTSLPTTLTLAALRERVTVRRDARGIPYIEAANEDDLYFAQGYVTASDRLWQMDLFRRTASGELSEIFGRATLEEDKRHRTFGFRQVAEATVARTSPALRRALESYARGVNAFIDARDATTLPVEFRILQYKPRPWRPSDTMLIGKLFDEALTSNWTSDLMRAAFLDLPPERRDEMFRSVSPLDVLLVGSDTKATDRRTKTRHGEASADEVSAVQASAVQTADVDIAAAAEMLRRVSSAEVAMRRSLERVGLYAEDAAASNNWVVSGKRSASGKPLLANDPHLSPSAPSIWHMVHLSMPGMRVAGVAAVSTPGVAIGHNEHIAWGITNLEGDLSDLYRENFDAANPRRYMTPDGWREAEVRREEIKVRQSPVMTAVDTETLDVVVTRHGPVVFAQGDARYALRWTALDAGQDFFGAFHAINRARNWKEFDAALANYGGPTFNFVYADVHNHIGYHVAGPVPIRKTGKGHLPYDGTRDEGEWTGFIPFRELPHLFDPPSGIIVTANSRVVGLDYPHALSNTWVPPYRARRIFDLLSAKPKLSAEDFRRIQADTYSFPDAIFTAEVLKTARPRATSDSTDANEWRAMVAAFDKWDGIASAESRVLPLAVAMRRAFRQKILDAALGAARAREFGWGAQEIFIDWLIQTRPRAWLPKEFDSYEALLLASYQEAREVLTKRLGADESTWTWGRWGEMNFRHPLAAVPVVGKQFVVAPIPQHTGGSSRSVNAGQSVSMRLIADAGDWDKTQQGIALGVSGDPASPHWKDQLADWLAVTPRVFPFSAVAVARATKTTLLLSPAGK
ncbi:MAG TPA: penicillin acylase family protein [Pyrinomonadaceae bacterium]|jgi:penicillin amidase